MGSVLVVAAGLVFGVQGEGGQELLDSDWLFSPGDVAGGERPELEDGAWRALDLPHDWSIEGPFVHDAPGDTDFDAFAAQYFEIPDGESIVASLAGYRLGGIGWYRKHFALEQELAGKRVLLQFDGVFMDADVWINGHHLGNHPYGYTSFYYDLTPYLRFAEEDNVLAVRVNVQQPCSRWYTGAGIYRHVWLVIDEPIHIAHWGTTITTPEINDVSATVKIVTQVENGTDRAAAVTLETAVRDPAGAPAGSVSTTVELAARGSTTVTQSVAVAEPKRWSDREPRCYRAVATLREGERLVDGEITTFGIRSFAFTKDRGFVLNGEQVPLRGVNQHHDQGCIGAAAYDRAMERQLEILKAMGCNAIRTAHNPPAPALLDLCDRMGFLVIEEAFDEWKDSKMRYGYGRFFDAWSEHDLSTMVRRDRNHPSVIAWSVGNEISEQESPDARTIVQRLVDICHREDPTRPVTAGCDKVERGLETGFLAPLDVVGVNQNFAAHDLLRDKKPTVGSETAYLMSTRGEYNLIEKAGKVEIVPTRDHVYTAYDLGVLKAKDFTIGVTSEATFTAYEERPWAAGQFVWSGFDYLGEPIPYQWPSRSSYYGIIDFCGFLKDRYYLYQSHWTDKPMVHLLPHWNWEAFAGLEIPVWCYTNCDSVELFLNEQSLGEKRMRPGVYHLDWQVPYSPGTLRAVGRRRGEAVCVAEVRTAGAPARIALEVDRKQIQAGGQDLAYITARVVDAEGRLCPDADHRIEFEVTGAGLLLGVGNGDPTSLEPFTGTAMSAFHGVCLAVVRSGRAAGVVRLTASSAGLQTDDVVVDVR